MEVKLNDILKEIDEKKLTGCLFVIGDEEYIGKVIGDRLKEKYTVKILWGDETDLDTLLKNLTDTSIFSAEGKNAVILKRGEKFLKSLKKKEKEKFISTLEKIKENLLVVFYETSQIKQDLSKEPLSSIVKKYKFLKAVKLPKARIREIIKKKFVKEGITVKDEDIELLIDMCNGDLSVLKQETDKLILYKERGNLSREELFKICIPTNEYSLFDLIDSMFTGDYQRLLAGIKNMKTSGIVPLQLLHAFSTTAIKILFVIKMTEEGTDIDSALSKVGVTHPFQKMKYKTYLKNLSSDQINKIISLLYEADRRIKVNYEDPYGELEKIVLNLINYTYNRGRS